MTLFLMIKLISIYEKVSQHDPKRPKKRILFDGKSDFFGHLRDVSNGKINQRVHERTNYLVRWYKKQILGFYKKSLKPTPKYTMVSKSYVHQHFFKKTPNRVKFETTVETNNESISRQTTMVFDYLHQTILIRSV